MFDPESILHSEVVKARFEAAGEATERCPESYRGGGFPATIRLALSLTRRRPCDVCGTPAALRFVENAVHVLFHLAH